MHCLKQRDSPRLKYSGAKKVAYKKLFIIQRVGLNSEKLFHTFLEITEGTGLCDILGTCSKSSQH